MTIKEFTLKQKSQSINEWIELIASNGLQKHESIILQCADHFNLITVDLTMKPNFTGCIKI